MSFGQPFLPYAVALHNPQLLLTTTGVQIVSSSSAAVGANLLNVPSKSASGSTGSQPISSASTAGQSSLGAPSVRAGSNSCANLLASSTESGEMSADSLRLLASAGAGHHGMVGPPPPGLIASAGSQAATSAGPPMPPIFAGMPSLDPYRLPPPPFGLYSGGISPAGGPLDLKMPDGLPPGAFAHPAPAGMPPFYYDPAFGSAYPYAPDRYGNPLDLNGARRKNATRETTAALKAWLYEHRKNPYPTKGEKIMLAIITKMTLTQVSTWFANARRRLKKENKMTWSPRNRPGEEDDGVDGNSNTQENSGGLRPGSSLSSLGDDGQDGADDDLDDLGTDPAEAGSSLNVEGAKHSVHGLIKPGETDDKSEASGSTKRLANSEEPAESPKKLKIWSIAETVATPDPSPAEKAKPPGELAQQQQQQQHHHHQGPYHFTFPPWPHMAAAAAFAGRSPLMQPANSAASSIAPNFPFGAVAQGPFGMPGSIASLPHPHQRPELFARNFFAPAPPPVSMMNAAAATGLPGFLNGFSFGCPAPAFPFGFNLPGASSAALGAMSTQMQPPQNGASETGGNSNEQQNESKCSASGSPVSSNGGRKSSISSQEPKTSTP